jgi:hypothetical protein
VASGVGATPRTGVTTWVAWAAAEPRSFAAPVAVLTADWATERVADPADRATDPTTDPTADPADPTAEPAACAAEPAA